MYFYKVVDSEGNTSYEERPIASEIYGATELTEEQYNAELEAFFASLPQVDPSEEATEADLLDVLEELGVIS